jgi:hypothetical protein
MADLSQGALRCKDGVSGATSRAFPREFPGGELRVDANRELRAMLLSVHPCPPLPQLGRGGDGSERVFSSHDFLATAIDRMLLNPDAQREKARRHAQLALCHTLAGELGDAVEKADTDTLYTLFTRFARSYASLYFEPTRRGALDIRFCPWADVCRGDPVHMAACAHLRALRIMRGIEPASADEFESQSYDSVLHAFARETAATGGTFPNFDTD